MLVSLLQFFNYLPRYLCSSVCYSFLTVLSSYLCSSVCYSFFLTVLSRYLCSSVCYSFLTFLSRYLVMLVSLLQFSNCFVQVFMLVSLLQFFNCSVLYLDYDWFWYCYKIHKWSNTLFSHCKTRLNELITVHMYKVVCSESFPLHLKHNIITHCEDGKK